MRSIPKKEIKYFLCVIPVFFLLLIFFYLSYSYHIEKKRGLFRKRYHVAIASNLQYDLNKNLTLTQQSGKLAISKVNQLLNSGHYIKALQLMKEFRADFGLAPQIRLTGFREVNGKSYIMYTHRYYAKGRMHYTIDINSQKVTQGLPGVKISSLQHFVSTINHELRHIAQYEENVHFNHCKDDEKNFFWSEQSREENPLINKAGILNSRMETDAYIWQLLAGGIDSNYQKLIKTRLAEWYAPVLDPNTNLKKDLEAILKIY